MSEPASAGHRASRTALPAAGAPAPATVLAATLWHPPALLAVVVAPGWLPYFAGLLVVAAALMWLAAATWMRRWRVLDAAGCLVVSATGFLYLLLAIEQRPLATVVLVMATAAAAAWIVSVLHADWKDARP